MASTLIVDQLQKTGGSLTALTLPVANASASEFLQNDGAGALSWASASAGFAGVHADVSSGSETYTVPTDITKLLVFITGAGGGGAAGASGYTAGGGHGATTVIARVTVVAADTITIAIGAGGTGGVAGGAAAGVNGGDSTFTHASGSGSGSMSTITSPGGKGALYQSAQTAPTAGTVGANNEGISILGGYGIREQSGAGGGASFWGGGGLGAIPSRQNPGTIGPAYGSGGGAGSSTASYQSGGLGADGVCFIMEFK
jgi:hypothetical protein